MERIWIILLLLLFTLGWWACQKSKSKSSPEVSATPFDGPPDWAKEAIWYQIFLERFHNGDTLNEPRKTTMFKALDDSLPDTWRLTPWNHDWYRQEDWAKSTGLDFYRTVQMRRYGGDLQGVLDKISHLKDLGINAIYFNPLNDAPSLHKYDARNYHHIDVSFGPDPLGDLALIASEDPADPKTWKWTAADKLFLKVVDSLHKAGIRVVLDFSWNHTGRDFWAFRDIQNRGFESPYKDWYEGTMRTNDEGIPYFDYEGWYHIKALPEWRKVNTSGKVPGNPYEGDLHPEVKQHIFDVCKRWMDPEVNGKVHKGIDGIRLDVAEHVPMGFWRDFRKFVRSVNPDFYLVGENWWTDWPHQLMDTRPWIQGDVFDAVMHYQWYKIARGYFAQSEDRVNATDFANRMDSVWQDIPHNTRLAMMNLVSSHDSPRVLSSVYNRNLYKYLCKPQENPNYRTDRPDPIAYERVKLLLLHQFTFIGAPHIWNGDELGMWGADDPDNRKPLWWPDVQFEQETQSSFSGYSYQQQVGYDADMHQYYKSIILLRKSHPTLTFGEIKYQLAHPVIVAYERILSGNPLIACYFNGTDEEASIEIQPFKEVLFNINQVFIDGTTLTMPPRSSIIIHKE
jgi:cyclomaltodextrinase